MIGIVVQNQCGQNECIFNMHCLLANEMQIKIVPSVDMAYFNDRI